MPNLALVQRPAVNTVFTSCPLTNCFGNFGGGTGGSKMPDLNGKKFLPRTDYNEQLVEG